MKNNIKILVCVSLIIFVIITISAVKNKYDTYCEYYCEKWINSTSELNDCESFHVDGYMGAVCKYGDEWLIAKDDWRTTT